MACAVAAPTVSQDSQDYQRKVRTQLDKVDTKTRRGPFHADWGSLASYRSPNWFSDAKFGNLPALGRVTPSRVRQ